MTDFRTSSILRRRNRKLRLRICRYVIYFFWVLNFIFTFADIYMYSLRLSKKMDCWRCLFKTYMIIAICVSVGKIPLLIVGIPMVFLKLTRRLRIYVTEYQAISDVLRLWANHKSLEFFEVHSTCCGVVGPDDYKLANMMVPPSCFKDRSGELEDQYQVGCSTRSVKPVFPVVQVVSVLLQYGLVLVLAVYLVILKRTEIRRRTMWSLSPTEVNSVDSDE
ncbi:uncharacterized protein LOC108048255 isoform X2 [Drosophila rhopaloa]|uniref:Uncharacterized protein LOC108048255 isoform X2 n=1 Tax=Drosophila rhopaloa TaxID=1041015 RepID=A0A6P4FFG4_DRORH|nr:uncharacterized protein LOC108048255 isoform X2 [Drosophila rhopaloa]